MTAVPFPDKLQRLVKQLQSTYDREHSSREEWISIHMDRGAALLEARGCFLTNTTFHTWLITNGFNVDKLNHQDRAAYIAMAEKPDKMKKVLEETDRMSIQHIYNNNRSLFTQVSKTKRAKTPRKTPEEKTKAAEESVRTARAKADAKRIKDEQRFEHTKIEAKIAFLRMGVKMDTIEDLFKKMEETFNFQLHTNKRDFPITKDDVDYVTQNLHPDRFTELTMEKITRMSGVFNAIRSFLIKHKMI